MLSLTAHIKQRIRDKAIKRTETRLLIAGRKPEEFSEEELEIIVKEEEDNLNSSLKEKGLLGLAALLGLSFWA